MATGYTKILDSYKAIIAPVIINDEGGWKLNPPDPNDQDGGWTFAGVTAKTWNSLDWTTKLATREEAANYIAEHFGEIEDIIYYIYYDQFVTKLAQVAVNGTVPAAMLSAAINCGVEEAIAIYKVDNGAQFCYNWMVHYIELVKQNSRAWAIYANTASDPLTTKEILAKLEKPTTLRAEYLKGWFNRVERYRNYGAKT